ncbi:MAG: sigma-54-dependent Fis family transcriptional regulator [Fidelibacterota bacterium]|nr:MAG: sigma-54-dependent Fis family transcriptional regulator [Candidatus Neomarinimicrobiota bacterium]
MKKANQATILLIEDDNTMREGIQTVLEKEGYEVDSAADGFEGSRLFQAHHPNLVITDLKLPGKSGMHLLNEFLEAVPSLPVVLISAYGTIDLAVSALKSGARDFIAKPFSIDELKTKVAEILREAPAVEVKSTSIASFYGMVGSSPEMNALKEQIRQVAKVDSPVLITGESGTGKELISRAIHSESGRRNGVFLAVNCGAFTDTLLQSELFGHEKGSFTGAIKQHQGIFEQADGGTILLDEIGEISPQLQVKLLRVLQHQAFQRLGGTEEISTDVRVIAATNQNLKEAIKEKRFRKDLYFRLNVIPIDVPPLRARQSDISELIEYVIDEKCRHLGRDKPRLSAEAIEKLQGYAWPGNIRELENLLERMLIFSDKEIIKADDIYLDEDSDKVSEISGTLSEVLEDTEYRMIKDALEKAGGIKQRAAKMLGIKTSTLYYKMEKYGLPATAGGAEQSDFNEQENTDSA